MADLHGFDATQVEPATPYEVIAAGKYPAAIVDSQFKPTMSGTGQYLELTFQIIDGPHKGRKLWARLNLQNQSQEAVRIARGELSAICRAVGVMQPKDSVDLHNIPLVIDVTVKKRGDTGELTNEIKGYAKKESATTESAQAPSNTPPWARS